MQYDTIEEFNAWTKKAKCGQLLNLAHV